MNKLLERRCKSCGQDLPKDARADRKYCSEKCKQREKRRRFRQRQLPDVQESRDPILKAENKVEHLEVEQFKLKQKLADRDRQIRNLKNALNRAELQVEIVAVEQAQRTRAVREQLAMANTKVSEVRRNWSIQADADRAGAEVTQLRERLANVTARFHDLVAKYRELSEAAEYAATERKHLQGIVRQWDSMCVRLYKATGGQPRRESDKKILATWTRFRKLTKK